MDTSKIEETDQTFCPAVWKMVESRLKELSKAPDFIRDEMNEAIWKAAQLWDGTHPGGLCRDRNQATKIIVAELLGEGKTDEMATPPK